MAQREGIMRKVQALLAKAASTEFDGERDALLAKADAMMAAYAIEQFEMDMARPAQERERPVVKVIEISQSDDYELRWRTISLFSSLARHIGVLVGNQQFLGGGMYGFKVVGYRSDLEWLEMLYTNVQLHLLSRMEPKPDANFSDLENFSMLRESGMGYERIFQLMGWPWEGTTDADGKVAHGAVTGATRTRLHKMRKAYQEKCRQEGRQPIKGFKSDTYRTSFMDGYLGRIGDRLYEMKASRNTAAVGKEVVIASRDSDLKEKFYEEFPDQRPHPSDCECDRCHYLKCEDESCTRPRCVEYNKNKNKPVRARAYRAPKVDESAHRLGREVANDIDLSNGRNVSGRKGGELS